MTLKPMRLLLACAVLIFGASQAVAKSDAADSGHYTTKDKEYYLTADQIFFIRPGLEVGIVSYTIPADMQLEVIFTLQDSGGLTLDMDGVTTPGPVQMWWTLAYVGEEGHKVNVLGSGFSYDRNGTYTDLGDGNYMFKFSVPLADGYDADATYTLGVVGRRNLDEFDLGDYIDNVVEHFVPSGAADPMPRDIVTTETCNGRCHDPLGMHRYGRFQEVQLCTQCHNPGIREDVEEANHARFDALIHSVHAEAHYPAEINDCQVCHTGGTPTENFPLAATPNPVPVCDGSGKGVTTLMWDFPETYEIRIDSPTGKLFAMTRGAGSADTGKWTSDNMEFFVVDPDSGETIQQLGVDNTAAGCTSNAPYSAYGTPGMLHTNWMDNPSRVVCGSCHSYIDWETGEGHSELNFPIDNDDVCAGCHRAYTGLEFDRSITGAHMPLETSSQFPGLIVEIVDVMNTNPGDRPTVYFTARTKNGPVDPNALNRLRISFWGPNEDFSRGDSYGDFREDVVGNAVKVGDQWAYTFEAAIPEDAEGSYSLGMEGRDEVVIDFGGGETDEERDVLESFTYAFAVTDAEAMTRRKVVDDANCESCHTNLALHGGGRRNANYCVTCHRPERLDIAEPAENVSFKWMIHKIHAGAELENGYTVVRSRGTYVFDDLHYPGDLSNCDKCHVDDSYKLPLPNGLLGTLTPNQYWSPMGPATSACVSCHDSDATLAHAYTNTTFFGESCSTCHGEGSDYDVEKVHAR